jgi:hypothetical protein
LEGVVADVIKAWVAAAEVVHKVKSAGVRIPIFRPINSYDLARRRCVGEYGGIRGIIRTSNFFCSA